MPAYCGRTRREAPLSYSTLETRRRNRAARKARSKTARRQVKRA